MVYQRAELYPDGSVYRVQRLKARLQVSFNLKWYPFDRQTFKIDFSFFGYTRDIVELITEPNLWTPALTRNVSSFEIGQGITNKNSYWKFDKIYGHTQDLYSAGSNMNYSHAIAQLDFHRGRTHFLLVFVFPLIVIVSFGCITFSFGIRELEARCTICTTLLVALVAFNYNIEQELPQVSYMLWINWYLVSCYCMILLQVFESIVILRIAGKPLNEQQLAELIKERRKDSETTSLLSDEDQTHPLTHREQIATMIDKTAAIGYPSLVFFMNVIAFIVVPY